MKKQINPNIKAHLIRSAFYVLLLLAVCAIPFALAQRNTTKRSVAKPKVTVTAGAKTRPLPPQGTCPTPWSFVASMPVDLYGAGGASDGTSYYSAGGYSFSTDPPTLAVFNRYDPGTDSWTPLPDMPQAAIMPTAVYYPPTNKIYVFGGEDGDSGVNYDITRIYDIASGTWDTGTPMPGVISFAAGGYVPATGKIYVVSGYNTGTVDSAQPNTWEYDPVLDTWNDLTATVPFPHPAGGMAYGVVSDKLYIAGGRDATNTVINLNWEFDPVALTYTPKANMPGSQANVRGSAVALDALFAFGGGSPFLAPGNVPTRAASAAGAGPGSAKAARASTEAASALARSALVRSFDPATIERKPLLPTTTGRTDVYVPATDTWSRSADMNTARSFPSGAFITDSNEIICSGGFDGGFTTASAEVLTPCIPPPPTPCPPTPTPTPLCGLTIGDGLTVGYGPSGFQLIASNIVNYTFSSSVSAPGDYAIFETHDPWGFTIVKDAITAAGHTYSEFTPADLAGFDFSQYRVIILNWDDTFLSDFGGNAACGGGAYIDALPALEAYAAAGGVVWVQGAVQGSEGDCFPLPFGGQSCIDFSFEDPIVQTCHPMMIGVENPIEGNYASHTSQTDLPAASNVVVINGTDSNPVLYDLACATPQPTPTPIPPLGCNTGLIHNGGFETGDFTTWVIDGTIPSPVVTNALSHSGRFSAFAGGNPPALQFCGFGAAPSGDSSFYQQFGPVPANATLSFWHWDCNTSFSIDFAWQDAYITDTDGNILQTIYHHMLNCESWVNQRVDLTPWVGQTIGVKFLVHEDGFGDLTSMLVDDVGVFGSEPCASPTPRPTPTPRPQPTRHPRP
jgi:hypothetical protein